MLLIIYFQRNSYYIVKLLILFTSYVIYFMFQLFNLTIITLVLYSVYSFISYYYTQQMFISTKYKKPCRVKSGKQCEKDRYLQSSQSFPCYSVMTLTPSGATATSSLHSRSPEDPATCLPTPLPPPLPPKFLGRVEVHEAVLTVLKD